MEGHLTGDRKRAVSSPRTPVRAEAGPSRARLEDFRSLITTVIPFKGTKPTSKPNYRYPTVLAEGESYEKKVHGWGKHDFHLISNPSHKGGASKTTSIYAISTALVRTAPVNVLMVDLDDNPALTHEALALYAQCLWEHPDTPPHRKDDWDYVFESLGLDDDEQAYPTAKFSEMQTKKYRETLLKAWKHHSCLGDLKPPRVLQINLDAHAAHSFLSPADAAGDATQNPSTPASKSRKRAKVEEESETEDNGFQEKLYLMVGTTGMNEWSTSLECEERKLAVNDALAAVSTSLALPYCAIQQAAYQYNCQIVMVDMSPGKSALNRYVWNTSDLFFLPALADQKSFLAIANAKSVLPDWRKRYLRVADKLDRALSGELYRTSNVVFKLPKNTPKFLGIIHARLFRLSVIAPQGFLRSLLKIVLKLPALIEELRTCTTVVREEQQAVDINNRGVYEAITVATDMTLPQDRYITHANGMPSTHDAVTIKPSTSEAKRARILASLDRLDRILKQPGILGWVEDYEQLLQLSEMASLPVPYLQRHHMCTVSVPDLDDVLLDLADLEQQIDPNNAAPPTLTRIEPLTATIPPKPVVDKMFAKVSRIRRMYEHMAELIHDVTNPGSL